jgi:FeS assembly SUF system protein
MPTSPDATDTAADNAPDAEEHDPRAIVPDHQDERERTDLETRIVAAIREVYDPEIPVNVYDLGLIYDIHIKDDQHVDVLMTLTAPNCPAAGVLPGQVEEKVASVEGVEGVELELTFDPPFSPAMMTEEAKLDLGFM